MASTATTLQIWYPFVEPPVRSFILSNGFIHVINMEIYLHHIMTAAIITRKASLDEIVHEDDLAQVFIPKFDTNEISSFNKATRSSVNTIAAYMVILLLYPNSKR